MRRAYDYMEYPRTDSDIRDNTFFAKETEIAHNILLHFPPAEKNIVPRCFCSKNEMEPFFDKWGVTYYRCKACGTIQVNLDAKILNKFKSGQELTTLWTSDEYQKKVAEKRDISWEELIDWLKFRTYRYLGIKHARIIDYGNRYRGLIEKIKTSSLSSAYELRDSILDIETDMLSEADIILYMDNLQCSANPLEDIKKTAKNLRSGGLLFLGTRIGTGFDILALREHAKIFPYEHCFLPSVSVLEKLLTETGYDVLETTTPGRLDVSYVSANSDKIAEQEYFIKFLIEHGDRTVFQELQRFLQKSRLSSYTQIVAQKR